MQQPSVQLRWQLNEILFHEFGCRLGRATSAQISSAIRDISSKRNVERQSCQKRFIVIPIETRPLNQAQCFRLVWQPS
jgi:hypothetical protein